MFVVAGRQRGETVEQQNPALNQSVVLNNKVTKSGYSSTTTLYMHDIYDSTWQKGQIEIMTFDRHFIGAVKIFQFNSMFITYQQSHIINRQTFENITETGLQVYSLVVEDKDTE